MENSSGTRGEECNSTVVNIWKEGDQNKHIG